jgi:hypothetical protein
MYSSLFIISGLEAINYEKYLELLRRLENFTKEEEPLDQEEWSELITYPIVVYHHIF